MTEFTPKLSGLQVEIMLGSVMTKLHLDSNCNKQERLV